MTAPADPVALLVVALLAAAILLDERGVLSGLARTPVVSGVCAGAAAGDAPFGALVGCVFQLLWPAPVRSGGYREPSPGVAAFAGSVAVAWGAERLSEAGGGTWAAEMTGLLGTSGSAPVAVAIALGSGAAFLHRAFETAARRTLAAREDREPPRRLFRHAVLQVLLGAAALTVLVWIAAGALRGFGAVAGLARSGLAGGAWPWLLVSAILGGAGQLARARAQREAWISWGCGVLLGGAGVFGAGSVW